MASVEALSTTITSAGRTGSENRASSTGGTSSTELWVTMTTLAPVGFTTVEGNDAQGVPATGRWTLPPIW